MCKETGIIAFYKVSDITVQIWKLSLEKAQQLHVLFLSQIQQRRKVFNEI